MLRIARHRLENISTMYLTRHEASNGPRWAVDGNWLPAGFRLGMVLASSFADLRAALVDARGDEPAAGRVLAPIEDGQEVWAAGVTYLRSREARMAESATADIYDRVYDAERVEVFFKANGWRVVGQGGRIRVRPDSTWDVPEPELALVLNRTGEIVGYAAGNDVSSRSIEGENPLYLPQAKVYDGSCALGPGIVVAHPDDMRDLPITLVIERRGVPVFDGETRTSRLKRSLEEIAKWLFADLEFPHGAFLMTGTGIVPPDEFSLAPGDSVRVSLGDLVLVNEVA